MTVNKLQENLSLSVVQQAFGWQNKCMLNDIYMYKDINTFWLLLFRCFCPKTNQTKPLSFEVSSRIKIIFLKIKSQTMRRFVFNVINNFYFISHKNLVITQENKQANKNVFLFVCFKRGVCLFVSFFNFKLPCPKNWNQNSVLRETITGFSQGRFTAVWNLILFSIPVCVL